MLPIYGGVAAMVGNSYSLIGTSQAETVRHTQSDAMIASSLNDQMNPRLSHHNESPEASISMLGDAA